MKKTSERPLYSDISGIDKLLPSNVSQGELLAFVRDLSYAKKTDTYVRLYAIFGYELLLFLSLFEGSRLKIPSYKVLHASLQRARVYDFLAKRKFTQAAYEAASKRFKLSQTALGAIVERIEKGVGQ